MRGKLLRPFPTNYGMGRMHSDAQFVGSSSVPAHVEMMGFIGMGNRGFRGGCGGLAAGGGQADALSAYPPFFLA